ncbi:MAG: Gfo/Idh/MocA family oxidoreductase [Candidatus Omnitrophica bacterium]|nr:Gfo/Idh/MocA family oxidoreductase [Candidatus Omnitrophota bacterium]
MKILIVGLGSIGRRHLRNLKVIAPDAKIGVWRQRAKEAGLGNLAPLVDQVSFSAQDALAWGADAALVTNPATQHIATGTVLAEAGVHLFVEKPLSHERQGVDGLIRLCHDRNLVLMVGYNFRFYKPLQVLRQALTGGRIGRPLALRAEVGQYLPDWRPGHDYRQSTSAREELGGGVVLELSHELDYVHWLMGEIEGVSSQIGHLSDLDIRVEDTAEIILKFRNGAIGSIHLDMVQRPPTRMCRIIGTEGTLTWDGTEHRVRLFSAGDNAWSDLYVGSAEDYNEMYSAELRHFLDCVREERAPVASGEDGRRTLEIALAVKHSASTQRTVRI